eukprot:c25920_g2_i1 orf=870-2858(+)
MSPEIQAYTMSLKHPCYLPTVPVLRAVLFRYRSQTNMICPVVIAYLLLNAVCVSADIQSDSNALIAFRNAVDLRMLLQWNTSVNACQWEGIQCSEDTVRVISVRLPGAGLFGSIPKGSLGNLSELQALSLRSNKLSGNFPSDLAGCTSLAKLYLENNQFSGPLPSDFSIWPLLSRIDLSQNKFNGSIPQSFNNLTHLRSLFLQNNSFSGSLPPLNISTLGNLSVANNQLKGLIPNTITYRRFSVEDFSGNSLCGYPLADCTVPGNPGEPSRTPLLGHKKKNLGAGAIAGICIGAVAFLLLLASFFIFLLRRKEDSELNLRDFESAESPRNVLVENSKPKYSGTAPVLNSDKSRLVFFENDKYGFDLDDLLRASAEVLGKGSVGTTYKAILEGGILVVVKRLKDVVIDRKIFEHQIETVGRLRHRHLVPLCAYFYSKDEKLLVYEYMPMGSLSALLHGHKGAGMTPLDWDTRLRVALGAARGIEYLHEEGGHKFTHGNIKSSNILLTKDFDGCVSDYGLAQLLNSTAAANRIMGYRAPEAISINMVSQKADVYSFGVLVLELLTGKAPASPSSSDEGIDLPRWVQSVVREEWTSEVFDLELMKYENVQEEMVQMLQVALACVASSPDQRPTMKQVVEMIENIRKINGDRATKQSPIVTDDVNA